MPLNQTSHYIGNLMVSDGAVSVWNLTDHSLLSNACNVRQFREYKLADVYHVELASQIRWLLNILLVVGGNVLVRLK